MDKQSTFILVYFCRPLKYHHTDSLQARLFTNTDGTSCRKRLENYQFFDSRDTSTWWLCLFIRWLGTIITSVLAIWDHSSDQLHALVILFPKYKTCCFMILFNSAPFLWCISGITRNGWHISKRCTGIWHTRPGWLLGSLVSHSEKFLLLTEKKKPG